ncbi:sensor domain-containing diguanylate cyclase [Psychromonas aquimarina]|uniref:sensor domain-containing diguanylate cyclase n=1 Tax=Psychromonas aquimarina TaxID=444919 RepID=UPI0003F90BD5|nr:GGDEF domain-containing protein [Psychromonas aquimarina]
MNSISRHITLKFISFLLISLILIMTLIQVASMLTIKDNVFKIQQLWDEVQVEQSEKINLENSIRSFLGYGGMIHKLKNSIINNNPEDLQSIKEDIHQVEAIIKLYLSFQLSHAERYALNDIQTVVRNYQKKVNLLQPLFQENSSIKKIDSFLSINNQPALRGLSVLEQNNRKINHQDKISYSVQNDKFGLYTEIIAQLGYGGLIHHIKNLQIRGDNSYAVKAQQKINLLLINIEKYLNMDLAAEEELALNTFQQTINHYQALLNNLKRPVTAREIIDLSHSQSLDNKALKALKILEQRIEIELKSKIFNVGEQIHSIQDGIKELIQAVMFLCIVTLLFFSYIMFKKVILPIQKVTQSMVSQARYHRRKEVVFHPDQIYEIKQMIRSIRIFKHHERKRRSSQKLLTKMNLTTLRQLEEIKELQAKSEQKTDQALTLANHLIELQKNADNDRKNALESQRRINTILNTVHDAIITTSRYGYIESINTAAEMMLGYSEDELFNQNITVLMQEDHSSADKHIISEHFAPQRGSADISGREQLLKRANGTTFPVEVFLGQSEFQGEIKYTAVIRDITQRKKDEEEIQHLVLTDPLTNLANRRHFNRELQHALDVKHRLQLSVGLLLLDLDNFKPVNDTLGHNMGDKVLQKVAQRLLNTVRCSDLTARLGGDEFAVIVNSVNDRFDVLTPAQKIIDAISKPMFIDGECISISVTIGVSISPQDALSLEEFIHHADTALYKAKNLGKGRHFSYQDLSEEEKSGLQKKL